GSVAQGIAFAVVHLSALGGAARQIRHTSVGVIAQRTPPEYRMIPIAGNLVVGSGDIPIRVDSDRSFKSVTHEVDAVAYGVVVCGKWSKGPEIRNHDVRADTDAQRVHVLDLGRIQAKIAGLDVM